MKIRPLAIEGAFEVTPVRHGDSRGTFLEWYRFDVLAAAVGHPLDLAQANLSTSARDVVRGIHFADVPPGQAKYVTCVSGAILDVIVDLRPESPTFLNKADFTLTGDSQRSLYVPAGCAHGFQALTDPADVSYRIDRAHDPREDVSIAFDDPGLAIEWPLPVTLMSERDKAAPSLAEATRRLT